MRTLQNNQVVLCKTKKHFLSVCIRLQEQGVCVADNAWAGWSSSKKETCIRVDEHENIVKYVHREYYIDKGLGVISYKLFMSEDSTWTPKIGDKVWFLSGCGLEVCSEPLTEEHNNKTDLQWTFKTRALARIAKQNLLECINKQVHG